MRAILAGLLLLLLLPVAASAEPGDLRVPLRVEPQGLIRYRIEKTEELRKDGAAPVVTGTQKMEVGFRVLGMRTDGYRMEMTYEKIENQATQAKTLGVDEGLAKAVGRIFEGATIVYTTDLAGNPLTIENLDDIKEVIAKGMATIRTGFFNSKLDEAAWKVMEGKLVAIETRYAGMTLEQANGTLLDDARPLFGTGDIDLPQGAEIHFDEKVPWAMTGTDIIARSKLWLASADERQAVVEVRSAYDRDSVRAGLAIAERQLRAKAGGNLPDHVVQVIRALENYDVTETQTTTLRRADGWPDTMVLERQTITGPERRVRKVAATRLN